MSDDRDLASILPDAPPPRPGGRDTAIEAAMRRFDGDDRPPPITAGKTPVRSVWDRWPQIGALTTAALVVIVSASVWRSGDHGGAPVPPVHASPEAVTAEAQSSTPANAPAEMPDAPGPSLPPVAVAPLAQVAEAGDTPNAGAGAPDQELAAAEPMQARAAPAPMIVPPAVSAPSIEAAPQMASRVSDAASPENASEGVVVTGALASRAGMAKSVSARARTPASVPRGDWNACTIDDPGKSLEQCRQILRGAGGAGDGPAADLVSDGLSRAWGGDLDGAIKAFDEAVRQNRKSSTAYLNRGLALARKGDFRRAIADMNRAVSLAPREARGYYQRSLLLASERPEMAQADAMRALKLDPAYNEVIR